jgi:hypothetical protein
MFFLFGWGQRTISDEGPTLSTQCQNCGNDVWLHLNTSKTWFTIFFIPVIPYGATNWLECPVCSRGFVLEGLEMLARARRLRALSKAFLDGTMSEDQYLIQAGNLDSVEQLSAVEIAALPAPQETGSAQALAPASEPEPRPLSWRGWTGIAAGSAIVIWMIIAAIAEDRARGP